MYTVTGEKWNAKQVGSIKNIIDYIDACEILRLSKWNTEITEVKYRDFRSEIQRLPKWNKNWHIIQWNKKLVYNGQIIINKVLLLIWMYCEGK
jgi:hypothetical protein